MMSSLVRFSIRFSGVIIGLACLVLLYGIYTLTRSNLDVFPEFSPTQIIIQTESPGLSAELVESLVSQPIESSIAGSVGIKSMRSQSIPGLSIVTVIFDEQTDIFRNRQVVAERLATLNNKLPPFTSPNIINNLPKIFAPTPTSLASPLFTPLFRTLKAPDRVLLMF